MTMADDSHLRAVVYLDIYSTLKNGVLAFCTPSNSCVTSLYPKNTNNCIPRVLYRAQAIGLDCWCILNYLFSTNYVHVSPINDDNNKFNIIQAIIVDAVKGCYINVRMNGRYMDTESVCVKTHILDPSIGHSATDSLLWFIHAVTYIGGSQGNLAMASTHPAWSQTLSPF